MTCTGYLLVSCPTRLGPALADEAVDEPVHGGGDELVLPSGQSRRPECLGHQVPMAPVFGAVHGQDDRSHDRTHGLGVDP